MKNQSLFKLSFSGLFAAIVCVMTLIAIPLPANGYANLGDCFVIISGAVLGPVYGPLAAGIGSMLSDIFLGYAVYAPATFVIKGIMALFTAITLGKIASVKGVKSIIKTVLFSVCAEIIMVLGYFAFEVVLYGVNTALADTLGNGMQGVVGALAATVLCSVLSATGIMAKIKCLLDGKN